MRIRARDLKNLIEDVAHTSICEAHHRALHEAEGEEACPIDLVADQEYKTIEAIRIIPHEDAYFGGEVRGSRGRGSTAATIPAGTMLRCIRPLGRKQGWFEVPGLEKAVRIDRNKFCDKSRTAYKTKKPKRLEAPPLPGSSAPVEPTSKPIPKDKKAIRSELEMLKSRLEALLAAEDETPEETASAPTISDDEIDDILNR